MKFILSILAFLLPIFAYCQTEGEVTYLETMQMRIELDDSPQSQELRKMLPTSQAFHRTLYFNESQSLYKDTPQTEEEGNAEVTHQSEGAQFTMKIQRPDNQYFKDLDGNLALESRDLFGRQFLVKGELEKFAWKMTGEQKTIAGYRCQKATFQDSTRSVEAWFAPQIQVSNGPSRYGQLPGLILELSIDNGNITVMAEKVELKILDKAAIEKPSKGKEVSQEEFKKIEEEKRKEMEEEMGGSGGGGQMRVIIRN